MHCKFAFSELLTEEELNFINTQIFMEFSVKNILAMCKYFYALLANMICGFC